MERGLAFWRSDSALQPTRRGRRTQAPGSQASSARGGRLNVSVRRGTGMILGRLAAALAFGSLISLIAALALAAATPLGASHSAELAGSSKGQPDDWPLWKVVRHERQGLVRVYSLWLGPESAGGGFGFTEQDPRPLLPPWANVADPLQRASLASLNAVIAVESGWPFRCLRGSLELASPPPVAVHHGTISIGDPPSLDGGHFEPTLYRNLRVIPYLPIWPGFLGNAVLYGIALFVTQWLFGAVQRLRRRRLGNCPSCGHHLARLDLCPECGWTGAHRPPA